MSHRTTSASKNDQGAFLSAYADHPTAWDQAFAADGRARPAWHHLAQAMASAGGKELSQRAAQIEAYLDRAAIVERVRGLNDDVQPWQLATLPILIAASEWARLTKAIAHRASWLNILLADAYGPREFVRSGAVPAALYAGSPEYVRALVGHETATDHPLRFYAVDVTRRADGQWCVLADRTQAPSGAGYALESRRAMMQAFPDVMQSMHITPLDAWFGKVALASLSKSVARGLSCVLSPGPMSETYFDQIYFARALGLALVEGQDLLVRKGRLYVRTIDGLQPCETLWRRMDSDFSDPLELNTRSRLGVAGLVDAVRNGHLSLINQLGSGLAESRAWRAILPRLMVTQETTSTALITPDMWWGMHDAERDAIAARFDSLIFASAFGAHLPAIGMGIAHGAALTPQDRQALHAHLLRRGVDIVAQQNIKLATTPVVDNGQLVPRPFVLRLFAMWTGAEWCIMPGGFARVADDPKCDLIGLQKGGRAADVWIVPDQKSSANEIDPHSAALRQPVLTTRSADNLFWLGRYLARLAMMAKMGSVAWKQVEKGDAHLYGAMAALLTASGAFVPFAPNHPPTLHELCSTIWNGKHVPQSLHALAGQAVRAASALQHSLSPPLLRALKEVLTKLDAPWRDPAELIDIQTQCETQAAQIARSLSRDDGAHLFDLGSRIEQAIIFARHLVRFTNGDAALAALLRDLHDHKAEFDASSAVPTPSQSLAHHIEKIGEHLDALRSPAAIQMHSTFGVIARATATSADFENVASALMDLSEEIMRRHIWASAGEGLDR